MVAFIMTQCLPKDCLVGRHAQLEDAALQVRSEPEERLALARRLCNAHTDQQRDKAAQGSRAALGPVHPAFAIYFTKQQ
jgi:hypothetical protein